MRVILPISLVIAVFSGGFSLTGHSPKHTVEKPANPWQQLEAGLELGTFPSPQPSEYGDSLIRVLRIEPSFFEFKLLNSRALKNGKRRSARAWAHKHGLVAAINASMYQADRKTSVSFMRTRKHVNNTYLSSDKTILAFDPDDPSLPPVQIIDRECQDFAALADHYGTLIQSIRMVSCKGENVWGQQSKKWSAAAIGMDRRGRILLIHVRSPYTTHDLIKHLLALPIDLDRAMYVEGGRLAQLFIASGAREYEFLGSYSTGSNENDNNDHAWPIPNVVGIVRSTTSTY